MRFIKVGRVSVPDLEEFLDCNVCVKYKFTEFKDCKFEYDKIYTCKEFIDKFKNCYFYIISYNPHTYTINLGVAEYCL